LRKELFGGAAHADGTKDDKLSHEGRHPSCLPLYRVGMNHAKNKCSASLWTT
jgi:hypothetical protein